MNTTKQSLLGKLQIVCILFIAILFVGCGENKNITSVKYSSFPSYKNSRVKSYVQLISQDLKWQVENKSSGKKIVTCTGTLSENYRKYVAFYVDDLIENKQYTFDSLKLKDKATAIMNKEKISIEEATKKARTELYDAHLKTYGLVGDKIIIKWKVSKDGKQVTLESFSCPTNKELNLEKVLKAPAHFFKPFDELKGKFGGES